MRVDGFINIVDHKLEINLYLDWLVVLSLDHDFLDAYGFARPSFVFPEAFL
jgi:hypothetical protein